jgi:hypothetical protein
LPERNPALKHTCRAFLDDALKVIQGKFAEGSPALSIARAHPDPPAYLIAETYGQVTALPSYAILVQELTRDSNIAKFLDKPIRTLQGSMTIESTNVPRLLLHEYLQGSPDAKFDEAHFDSAYSFQEDYLYSESTRFVSFTPLLNLNAELETLEVEAGLAIRKISEGERKVMRAFGWYSDMGIGFATHGIEQIADIPKLPSEISAKAQQAELEARTRQVSSLLTALRLFKPGTVGTGYTLQWYDWSLRVGAASGTSSSRQPWYFGLVYQFSESDADPFIRLFTDLSTSLTSEFDIAIRRFNYYYERPFDEDKILDALIAFENLLLPEKDELSLRLAIRVANLLGENSDEKRTIFEFMRKAYGLRSDIAHGSPYDSPIVVSKFESYYLNQFVEQCHDYLRKSIVKIIRLQRDRTKKQLIDELTNPF